MTPAFVGIYRGTCINNIDPEGRHRIIVTVPQVSGAEQSAWAMPCVPPGFFQGIVKPHATHTGHANHVFTDHNDGEFSSGNSTTTLVHDHNHDAHTNNVLPSGSDPGGHVLHQATPKIGQGVWVMFEAGNPRLPIWLGVWT